VINRASPTDRAFLAMDTGEVPEQFGVILMLADASDVDLFLVRRLIAERVPSVPRLRQRLVRVPVGCGGPIWVDDLDFDVRRHVHVITCPSPGNEQALLDAALSMTMTRLPRTAPLWSALLITGLADGGAALVLVLHHVLADGIGGWRSWQTSSTYRPVRHRPVRHRRAFPGPHPARPWSRATPWRAGSGLCAVSGSHGACCARRWPPGVAFGRRGRSPVR
jgi:hypothetical protein